MQKRKLNKKRFFTVLLVLIITVLIVGLALNRDRLGLVKESPSPAPTDSNISEPPAQTNEPAQTETASPEPVEDPEETKAPKDPRDNLVIRTDYEAFGPNESGEIPIVMFHSLIEAYEENTEKEYTTTFAEFEALLQTLYDLGFRLISMSDYIECNISVPAGTMPMVFTFDDGTAGQFNLIEENGELKVNPKSAAGILMAFNEKHPDFGQHAMFYVNMDKGDKTFEGAGTLKERFEILLAQGFELGNHTWGHVKYSEPVNNFSDKIQESLGKNQEKAYEIIPDLEFYSLALPYGHVPVNDDLKVFLEKGSYNGVEYENKSIMAVGANPAPASISKNYNNGYVARIRAQGRVAVECDLTWWLPKMTQTRMFVSDGDPDTIVVPSDKAGNILEERLNGKTLVTY